MKRYKLLFVGILTSLPLFFSCGNKTYEEWKAECDSIGDYRDGYALCEKEGKWFFIDENGKKRTQDYDEAQAFNNHFALVKKYENGNEAIIFLNENCEERTYPIKKLFGLVNTSGNIWVTIIGDRIPRLLNVGSGSIKANLESDEQLESISSEGITVISKNPSKSGKRYDVSTASGFSSAMLDAYNQGRARLFYELLSADGDTIAPFGKYSYIGNYVNGMAKFSTTGYLRASDSNDERLRNANEEECNRGYVYGLIGFLDANGKVAVPERYRRALVFNKSGYAYVSYKLRSSFDESCEYIIDKNGNELIGKELIVAKASFRIDGQWESGRDKDGNYVIANNKGVIKTLEPGGKWATVKDLLAQKDGKYYKFYRLSDDDVKYLYTIEGTGNSDEVICYRKTHIIEVFNGHYCQKYDDETGQLITDEYIRIGGPHDMVGYGHRLHSAYEWAAYFFE